MSSNKNFTEWSREEKEKFAEKRMEEMKLKNEKIKKRHAEVEFDRIAAEKQNSAITNVPKAAKKDEKKIKHAIYEEQREWDRGKPDLNNWESPQHSAPIYSSRAGKRRRYRDKYRRKSYDAYRYGQMLDSKMKFKKEFRSKKFDNHHNASYRYKSPEKRIGFGRNNESYKKPYAYSDKRNKKYDINRLNTKKRLSSGPHSQSTSRSDSDNGDNVTSMKISSVRVESLWDDKMNEDRNKQIRTESWINSITQHHYKNWARSASGKSYSMWDSESSDEDFNKKNFRSKFVAAEIKSAKSGTAYNPENHANAEMGTNISKPERFKGIKSKRSPQSTNSGKHEHVRKQRRFDRGFREENASKYSKFKQQSNMKSHHDSWNDSSVGNKNSRNERSLQKTSNFVKAKSVNETYDDNWDDVIQDNRAKKSENDDMWENAEQSDIKWALSDDETTLLKSKKELSETIDIVRNSWNENELPSDKKVVKRIAAKNYKSQKQHNYGDSYQNRDGVKAYDDDDPNNLWNKFKQDSVNVETKASYQNRDGVKAYVDDDADPNDLWNKFKQDSVNVETKASYQNRDGVKAYVDDDADPNDLWNKFKQDSVNVETKASYQNRDGVKAYVDDDADPNDLWNKFKQDSVNVETKASYQNRDGVKAYVDDDADPNDLWNKFKQDSVNVETKDSYKNQEAVQASDEDPENLWNKFKEDSCKGDSSNSKRKIPESTGAYESVQYGCDANDATYLADIFVKITLSSDESWLTEDGEIHSEDESANAGKNKGSTSQ